MLRGVLTNKQPCSSTTLSSRRAPPLPADGGLNFTPLVDVILVLLIVFLVTAPLLTIGIPVDLPKVRSQVINQPDEPLVVSIRKDGQTWLQETPMEIEAQVPHLVAITESRTDDTNILVHGDQAVAYGRVMQVMSAHRRRLHQVCAHHRAAEGTGGSEQVGRHLNPVMPRQNCHNSALMLRQAWHGAGSQARSHASSRDLELSERRRI